MQIDTQKAIDQTLGPILCRLLSWIALIKKNDKPFPPSGRIGIILLSEMGSLVLAHNSVNAAASMADYLDEHQPQRMRTRSFIKVQDGCNNRCAYCVTTLARGESRSMPIESILADIHAAEREELASTSPERHLRRPKPRTCRIWGPGAGRAHWSIPIPLPVP